MPTSARTRYDNASVRRRGDVGIAPYEKISSTIFHKQTNLT